MENTESGTDVVYEELVVETDPAAYSDPDARPSPPKMLSPSRMEDFGNCPRQFFYKSVLRLPTTPSPVAAKGTVAHAVLEMLFEKPREERTVETAVGLLPVAWESCLADDYHAETMSTLFDDEPNPDEATAAFFADVRSFVENYFTIENPQLFDPVETEMWVRGWIDGNGYVGVIDRLDRVNAGDAGEQLWVVDYKTGKMPDLRWAANKFNAMKVYAVLLSEQLGETPTKLRLVYIGGTGRDRVLSVDVNDATISNTKARMRTVSTAIAKSVKQWSWPAKVSKLCDWCDFQDICPAVNGKLAGMPVTITRKVK